MRPDIRYRPATLPTSILLYTCHYYCIAAGPCHIRLRHARLTGICIGLITLWTEFILLL